MCTVGIYLMPFKPASIVHEGQIKITDYSCQGGLLYLNMVLGNNQGFENLNFLIENMTSEMSHYRDEIISKIEVYNIRN